jgi:hypothetical protein
MNEASVIQYITGRFERVETFTNEETGDNFFFCDPERKFPFATLVTNDNYDSFSNLNRPSIFRLNIGISKQTFLSLFGTRPSRSPEGDATGESYDFTALDQLMPHPVYGRMYWVCVLSPSDATFEVVVKPLLAEAYEMDASKYAKRAARSR